MELLGVLFFFGLLVVVVFAFLGLARVQNGPPVEVENLIRRGFAQHNIVAHGRTIFGIKPNQEIFVQTNELRKSEIPISSIKKVDLTSRRYWNLHIIDVFTVSFGLAQFPSDEIKLESTDRQFFERVVVLLHTHLPSRLVQAK